MGANEEMISFLNHVGLGLSPDSVRDQEATLAREHCSSVSKWTTLQLDKRRKASDLVQLDVLVVMLDGYAVSSLRGKPFFELTTSLLVMHSVSVSN